MPTLHLVASLGVSAFLLGLSVILAGPAFELTGLGPRGGLHAGALPQFVVVVVAVLAVISAVSDLRRWWVTRSDASQQEEPFASPDQVLKVGGGVLALLALYVFAWRPLPFPLITMVFVALVSLIVAPPAARAPKGLAIIGLTSVLFSLGVWLVFTYVLKVPLR